MRSRRKRVREPRKEGEDGEDEADDGRQVAGGDVAGDPLVLARSNRVSWGVLHCYVILKESDEFKIMKEQLQAYSQTTQELGKGRGLGHPSLFAFGGSLLALKN